MITMGEVFMSQFYVMRNSTQILKNIIDGALCEKYISLAS